MDNQKDTSGLELERYVPTVLGEIQLEHYHRYNVISKFISGKTVLDIACGEGYGSAILAKNAKSVLGMDISGSTINLANDKYKGITNLSFQNASVLDIPLPDNSIDIVVSFETIEHLADHEVMVAELRRVLSPSGFLVLSSPDRDEYNKFSDEHNHFHVKELSFTELDRVLKKQFPAIRYLCQSAESGNLIYEKSKGSNTLSSFHINGDGQVGDVLINRDPKYYIAFCSDESNNLPLLTGSIMFSSSYRLIDTHLEVIDWANSLYRKLVERDAQIIDYNEKIERVSAWGSLLSEQVKHLESLPGSASAEYANGLEKLTSRQNTEVQLLEQKLFKSDSKNKALKQENSNLRVRLFEVSDWATLISRKPIQFALKKLILTYGKKIWSLLPLPVNKKDSIKRRIFSFLNKVKKPTSNKSTQLNVTHAAPMSIGTKPSSKRDVLVFAVIDWHFRTQRPQHISSSLAIDDRRVFYFSNHFVDNDKPGYQIERLSDEEELYQIKLHVKGAPAIYYDLPSDEVLVMLRLSLGCTIHALGLYSSISVIQHTYWYPLVKSIPNSFRIYDCMDHHEGFGNVAEKLVEVEKEMLSSVDLVTVTSTWLKDFALKHKT